jgi:starch-binding outer membrane protein, SusD/RagB family
MKRIFKIMMVFILAGLLFTNCGKEWLAEPTLYGIYDASGFVSDDESALQVLDGVYSNLLGRDMNWAWFTIGDCMSDDSEAGGEATGSDTPEFQAYTEFRHNSAGGQLSTYWDFGYSGIFRANSTIVTLGNSEAVSEDFSKRLVAEAKFLRSIFHFRLMRIFGPVPYLDQIYDPTAYAEIPRTPIAESLHAMQKDMSDIFDDLPGRASSLFASRYGEVDGDGRPGKDAARAMLIKLLAFESSYSELAAKGADPNSLYEGCEDKWDQVRTLADNMIDSAAIYGVSLDPDWGSLWRVRGEGSDEIIWKINHSYSLGTSGTDLPGSTLTGTYWNVASDIMKLSTVRSATEVVSGAAVTDHGWGWNTPTQEYVDLLGPDDPRLPLCVFSDGDTIEVHRSTDVPDKADRQALGYPSEASPTGYNHRKYEYILDESGSSWQQGALDIKVIRYADVLLWAAEAHMKAGGNTAKALEYVNEVRTRARNISTPASTSPADLGSVTLQDVMDERRRELAFESHRYFDLQRWGLLHDNLNGKPVRKGKYVIEFEEGKHEYLPIPASVISETNGVVTQTPWY